MIVESILLFRSIYYEILLIVLILRAFYENYCTCCVLLWERRHPSYTAMKLCPIELANFRSYYTPFTRSYLLGAEYLEELIDFEVGRFRGGILLDMIKLSFSFTLVLDI